MPKKHQTLVIDLYFLIDNLVKPTLPATMKLAAPKANPGLYIPMALAITFPFNITLGMPLYLSIIQSF